MKNPIIPTVIASLLATSFVLPAWSADAASDVARVTQQVSEMPNLERTAAQAAGWKSVNFRSAAHRLTVTVTDSPLTSSVEREVQASKMVAALEAGMAKEPAFTQISVIHVDCVKRAGQTISPVQGFDFNQTPAGAFV